MNKKISYILCVFLLLLSACRDESTLFPESNNEEMVKVSFTVNVQQYTTATRATVADENAIINLSLLVFNENGDFLSRHEANISGTAANGNLMFNCILPSSQQSRIIHFISNYNWAQFNNDAAFGKDEGEVVAALRTNRYCMWQRVELTDGISETSFSAGNPVELLRNMAKVKVFLGPEVNSTIFQRASFKVIRKPNIGTVSPFDSFADEFTQGVITEPVNVAFSQFTPYFINVNIDEYDYSFERENSLSAENNRMAIILLGLYQGEPTYYKIDLIDNETGKPFDVQRNYYYKITILNVLKKGFATEQEAINNTAANNRLVNVRLDKYPIITNIASKLEVEKTTVFFPFTGGNLNTWYNYYPDFITNPTVRNNGAVGVTVINDELGILNGFSYSNGVITATVPNRSATANSTDIYKATIRVSVNTGEGVMYRDISIEMRELFDFQNVTLNDKVYNALIYDQGEDAILKFTVPPLSSKMFPMEIQIDPSPVLYPASSDLTAKYKTDGSMYYVYTVNSPGQKIIHFKMAENVDPNSVSTSRAVVISSNGFNDATIIFNNQYIFQGNILYNINSIVPIDADIYSSDGDVGMVRDGVYWGFPPIGFDPDDPNTYELPYTLTYRKVYSENVTRLFSVTKTAGQLLDQEEQNVVLGHTSTIMTAKIVSPDGLKVLNGSKISAEFPGTTVTSSSIKMIADNTFSMQYNFEAGTIVAAQDVIIQFATRNATGNSMETRIYTANTSLANILENNYTVVNTATSPNIIELSQRVFAGSLYFRNPIHTHAASATATISSSVGNVVINYDGAFTLTVPGTFPQNQPLIITAEEDDFTYEGTFTIQQLQQNSNITLVAE